MKGSFWPRREVRVVFFSHIVIEQWAEYPLVLIGKDLKDLTVEIWFYNIAHIVAAANAFLAGSWRDLCGWSSWPQLGWDHGMPRSALCIERGSQGKRLSQYLDLSWATGDSVFIYDRSAEIMMHVCALQKQRYIQLHLADGCVWCEEIKCFVLIVWAEFTHFGLVWTEGRGLLLHTTALLVLH